MARMLFALGRWAVAHRGRVLLAWLLLLIVAGCLGTVLHGRLSSVFTVPGTESQNAQNLLQAKFPAAAGGDARIVFAAPPGITLVSPKDEAAIGASLRNAARVPGVIAVSDPFRTGTVSAAKTVGYADVLFGEQGANVPQSARDGLAAAVAPARAAGLQAAFGGTAFASQGKVSGGSEVTGVVVAFVVLAVALSSPAAAGLPLLTRWPEWPSAC